MNTISSLGNVTMDGQNYKNIVSNIKKSVEQPVSTLQSPTAAEVASEMEKNKADLKADAQQLQKMSDLVMGRKLQFNVNEELKSVIVKVVDPSTNQVLKEIPSEDMQKLKIRLRKTMGIIFDDLI